ncbi:MAG TPA: polysaccharide deacetylase family protein [Chthonomonadales bacterium]|nr:polysaccharide deacetylase family protein [Chthonomonadales bacterium]
MTSQTSSPLARSEALPGTILLGIDVETADENAAGFVERGLPLVDRLGVPVTWYVTGRTLERWPDRFRHADAHPLVDIQSHTHAHLLLKTILTRFPPHAAEACGSPYQMVRGASTEEIDADLARAQSAFLQILGRRAEALTGPWCYYRGLGDRPDLLEIVHRHGFRILRTFGRNAEDSQPVPLEWQPFAYAAQGFQDILEILVHDYQDDFLWEQFAVRQPGERYTDHLRAVAETVAARGLVWSMASHDHGSATEEGFERKASWIRDIVPCAAGLGIRFLTARQYAAERAGRAPAPPSTPAG